MKSRITEVCRVVTLVGIGFLIGQYVAKTGIESPAWQIASLFSNF